MSTQDEIVARRCTIEKLLLQRIEDTIKLGPGEVVSLCVERWTAAYRNFQQAREYRIIGPED